MEKRRMVEKLWNMRSNNITNLTLIDDTQQPEFLKSLIEAIRKYSCFLNKSQLVAGKPDSRYIFAIEDDANVIQLLSDGTFNTRTDIVKTWECSPKGLVIQILVPRQVENFYNNNVENILTNILYKPFTKAIEKQVISGDFFDKPLFSTTNTITGTNDFAGLLQLVRTLKNAYDDSCIIGNSSVISGIVDTIDIEAYLNEYLLKGTIEGVQIVSSKDAPTEVDDKFLVGFDPNKIGLLLIPQIYVRKLSTIGVDHYFQIFCLVNGGDIFNSAIGIKE
jgi:hypothetical protein